MRLGSPAVYVCRGKARPGDRPGYQGLHVWKRNPDQTATCQKCRITLTVEDADDVFTQR